MPVSEDDLKGTRGNGFQRHPSDSLAKKEIKPTRLLVDPKATDHVQAQQVCEKGGLARSELRQLVLFIVGRAELTITPI